MPSDTRLSIAIRILGLLLNLQLLSNGGNTCQPITRITGIDQRVAFEDAVAIEVDCKGLFVPLWTEL